MLMLTVEKRDKVCFQTSVGLKWHILAVGGLSSWRAGTSADENRGP